MQLLITGLQTWRTRDQPPSNSPVALWQLSLGLEAVLDGWISLAWREHQEADWVQCCQCKLSKWWTVELIKKLWNVSWDMWDHQNEALHNSKRYWDEILDSKINDQIHECFNQGMQAVLRDAFALFQQSLEELLQHPQHYKEKWMELVRAAKKRKIHHEHGAYLSKQHSRRWWLGLEEPN